MKLKQEKSTLTEEQKNNPLYNIEKEMLDDSNSSYKAFDDLVNKKDDDDEFWDTKIHPYSDIQTQMYAMGGDNPKVPFRKKSKSTQAFIIFITVAYIILGLACMFFLRNN